MSSGRAWRSDSASSVAPTHRVLGLPASLPRCATHTSPTSDHSEPRSTLPVVSKAAPPADTSRPAPAQPASERDVRASRLYLLSRGPIVSALRRVASIAALVVLDVIGLALG